MLGNIQLESGGARYNLSVFTYLLPLGWLLQVCASIHNDMPWRFFCSVLALSQTTPQTSVRYLEWLPLIVPFWWASGEHWHTTALLNASVLSYVLMILSFTSVTLYALRRNPHANPRQSLTALTQIVDELKVQHERGINIVRVECAPVERSACPCHTE